MADPLCSNISIPHSSGNWFKVFRAFQFRMFTWADGNFDEKGRNGTRQREREIVNGMGESKEPFACDKKFLSQFTT